VSVLAHGPRTEEIARDGLAARDMLDGPETTAPVRVVGDFADTHDLILLAVRRDKITAACQALTKAPGVPTVLVFGNNSGGRAAIPSDLPCTVVQGVPGIGGVLSGGQAHYSRITQQPTTIQAKTDR
jgi:ketopantoate reductase